MTRPWVRFPSAAQLTNEDEEVLRSADRSAEVAQLVEHVFRKDGVVSSILTFGSKKTDKKLLEKKSKKISKKKIGDYGDKGDNSSLLNFFKEI
jgi:hypothetical protein